MRFAANELTRQVDGTLLHWAEAGAGRPLVLLHGLSDSHRTWQHVARAMSGTRRVLMPDLPGHGLSGRPDVDYDLEWHARVVGRWMDDLGLDGIDLVGHSYGGGVAQFLLLTHGARVRRLGLVASGGLGREVSLGLRLLSLPGTDRLIQPLLGLGTRVSLLAAGAHSRDERRWQARANSVPGTARALVRTIRDVIDLRGQRRHFLDRVADVGPLPPLAIFWGERDPIIPVSHARLAQRQILGARLTTFPDCGHFPHLEQPRRFLRALAQFLEDPAAQRVRIVNGAEPPRRRSSRGSLSPRGSRSRGECGASASSPAGSDG